MIQMDGSLFEHRIVTILEGRDGKQRLGCIVGFFEMTTAQGYTKMKIIVEMDDDGTFKEFEWHEIRSQRIEETDS